MFESYKVAVRLTAIDDVSRHLGAISTRISSLDRQVTRLGSTFKALFAAGTGYYMLRGAMNFLKPAEEYAHQLNIMNMAGMKHREIAESIAAAWQTTHDVVTSTATGNLRTILDLRNVFGNTKEAIEYLPEFARISAVLKSSSESGVRNNAENIAYSMAKALDIRGAVSDRKAFNTQAEAMAQVITATQGRVLPEDYRMLFKYARQSTMGLSNEFLYQELPTFMMEMKGQGGSGGQGGFGTSLAAFYRFFVQGVMSKASLQALQNLGLINQNAGLKTTTTGTMLMSGEHIKGVELAQSDQFKFVQQILLPAIRNKYGNNLSQQQLGLIISDMMKNSSQTAQFAVMQYAFKAQNVYRDQQMIQQAKIPSSAFALAMSNDPIAVNTALKAQWENFKTAFGMAVVPVILPGLMKLTEGLNTLANFFRKHQTTAKALIATFTALGVAFLGLATVATVTVAITSLAAILNPVGLAIIGVTAALYGLYKVVTSIVNFIEGGAKQITPDTVKRAQTERNFFASHALNPYNDPLMQSFVATFDPTSRPINIHIDGQKVAQVVSKHQARAAALPPVGGSIFDPNAALLPVQYNTSR